MRKANLLDFGLIFLLFFSLMLTTNGAAIDSSANDTSPPPPGVVTKVTDTSPPPPGVVTKVTLPPAADWMIENARGYLRDFLGDLYVENHVSLRHSTWNPPFASIVFNYFLCEEVLVIQMGVYEDGNVSSYNGPSKPYQCNIDENEAIAIAKAQDGGNECPRIDKSYISPETSYAWIIECRGGSIEHVDVDIETGEVVGKGYFRTSSNVLHVGVPIGVEEAPIAEEYVKAIVGEEYFEKNLKLFNYSYDENFITFEYSYTLGIETTKAYLTMDLKDRSVIDYNGPTKSYELLTDREEAAKAAREQDLKETFDLELVHKNKVEEGDENKVGKDYVWMAWRPQTENTIKGDTRLVYVDIETGKVLDVKYFETGKTIEEPTIDGNGKQTTTLPTSQQNEQPKDFLGMMFAIIGEWIESIMRVFNI